MEDGILVLRILRYMRYVDHSHEPNMVSSYLWRIILANIHGPALRVLEGVGRVDEHV